MKRKYGGFTFTVENRQNLISLLDTLYHIRGLRGYGFIHLREILQVKVEKILKGSLYLISSPCPSLKIQIMGSKVCLWCKGKILLGIVNKFENKKCDGITQQCFAFLSQVNFPTNNLNLY